MDKEMYNCGVQLFKEKKFEAAIQKFRKFIIESENGEQPFVSERDKRDICFAYR